MSMPEPDSGSNGASPTTSQMKARMLSKAQNALNYGAVIVSIMIVTGFFGTLFFLLAKPFEMSEALERLITVVVGSEIAAFMQVCTYWLGSSAGSARKDVAASAPMPAITK